MRILQWCEFYPPFRGGIEVMVSALSIALAAQGHDILVVTGAGDGLADDETIDGVRIRRFAFREAVTAASPLGMMRLLREIGALKREFGPDLVHLHFVGPSCFFHLRTMDAHKAPTLVTIHGEFRTQAAGAGTLLGDLLQAADWVTGVSQAMLSDVTDLAPDVAARASVVYNGVASVDSPASPQAAMPTLFCFGRHVPDKGLDIAIDAFAHIKRRGVTARLIIGSDGPERPNLEAQVARLGLQHEVRFVGWLDESALCQQIDHAHAVIIPSRWREGFGLVAVEAALRGRPVVATTVGGLPVVVLDGVTGLLVAPEDSPAMADAIMTLLEHPARARILGGEARRRASAHFSLGTMCAGYQAIYGRLVSRTVLR